MTNVERFTAALLEDPELTRLRNMLARGTTHLWCKPRSICLAAHYGHDGQPDGPSKIVIKTVDLTECVGIPADANMADCIDLQELLVRSGRALNRKVVRGTA